MKTMYEIERELGALLWDKYTQEAFIEWKQTDRMIDRHSFTENYVRNCYINWRMAQETMPLFEDDNTI